MSKPTRLPTIATLANRDQLSNKDAKLVNGYVEKSSMGELWCYKRPGLKRMFVVVGSASTGNGLYYWDDQTVSVFGSGFYSSTTLVDTVSAAGAYSFAECLGATPVLFFHNVLNAYVYDGSIVTDVVDVDYPSTTVPGSVFIDGTMYVMTPAGFIQGSAINDPTSWDLANSIQAQIEGDDGVAIAKQLNYLIAFKEYSVEAFYDAQNVAGSPLGRVEAAKLSYGCANGYTVLNIDGDLLWVTNSRLGNFSVAIMHALKAEIVSTPAVERLLQLTNMVGVSACAARISGHKFYLLSGVGIGALCTLVYDINEKAWYEWFGPNLTSLNVFSSSTDGAGRCLIQGATDGNIYAIDTDTYLDNSLDIQWELVTLNFDGGTRQRKMADMLEIDADQQPGGRLEIRYSDDDYQTWSRWLSVDLSADRFMLSSLGTFNRRAHHLRHRQNLPLRIKSLDLSLQLGTI